MTSEEFAALSKEEVAARYIVPAARHVRETLIADWMALGKTREEAELLVTEMASRISIR